jgi:hypothetical protein
MKRRGGMKAAEISRREFLKRSGGVAVAAVVVGSLVLAIPGQMSAESCERAWRVTPTR